jgi:DNA adenine methylase
VTTFYRVVREHHGFLMDTLRWLIASRAEFERQKALPAKHLTDVQRAARFLYLQRLAWGGRVTDQSFGVSAGLTSRFNVLRLERDLVDLHDRLAHVVVEQLPFADFIRRYDRPETLFYLDPPYWGSETDYDHNVFGRGDFDELAAQLAAIKGKFLVSLNDTPGVRASYAGFQMRSFETTYYSSGRPQRAGEILISNDDVL